MSTVESIGIALILMVIVFSGIVALYYCINFFTFLIKKIEVAAVRGVQ